VWTPDPTVFVTIDPVAIGIEILAAPNILVVIPRVVLEALRQVTLAVRDPTIDRIGWRGRHQVPIAGVFAVNDEFGSASVAKRETGSIRIDSCAATFANGQANATVFRNVNPVKSIFLSGESGFGCIDFEVAAFAIKVCKTHRHRSLENADRDALVAQSNDAQDGVTAKPNKVARVDLYFEVTVDGSRDSVAFDERIVQFGRFPIITVVPFQADFAVKHADAYDASFHVVIVGIIVVVSADCNRNREKSEKKR
jgi:hypothetical protein